MAKKKGPLYEDDPGCKYIVIEDPWPGNKIGKDRDEVFWNKLGAWVFYMLDKKHDPESIFSMNTVRPILFQRRIRKVLTDNFVLWTYMFQRREVIVRLPEEVDVTPLLGVHPWRRFLTRGQPSDINRASFIFEYNYRIRGEPEKRTDLIKHSISPPPAQSDSFPPLIFRYLK